MRTRQLLAIFGSGVGIGILVGLAVSPVVQTVISAVLAVACGATAVLAGIGRIEAGDGALPTRSRADPMPVSFLVIGLVAGALGGILLRTNGWLSRSPETEVARWAKTGWNEEEIYRRLFEHEYPVQAALTKSAEARQSAPDIGPAAQAKEGVLFSDPTVPIGKCATLLRSKPEEIRSLFLLTNSKKLQHPRNNNPTRHFADIREGVSVLRTLKITLGLSAALGVFGQAPTPLFLVRAYECPGSQPSRSLTAFRVAGVAGAVTTLHGVAGCQSIRMESEKGPGLASDVSVSQVNIDADLATLESPELELKFSTGYPISDGTVAADAQLAVFGYPEGLLKPLRTIVQVRRPAVVPLSSLLSEKLAGELSERTSPSVLLPIVSIQGSLLPGHSGAPIFDQNSRVVAIADGGLKQGADQISWAIPVSALRQLRPSKNSDRLATVVKYDSAILFSLVSGGTSQPSTFVALRTAAQQDDVESLRRILQVATTQRDKDRALATAVNSGAGRAIKLLIDSGADLTRVDAICMAVDNNDAATIQVLAQYSNRLNPNVVCDSRVTVPGEPLQVALNRWKIYNVNTLEVIRALLRLPNIDVNVSEDFWGTPLHMAVTLRSEALTSLLVRDKRVQISKINSSGETPADAACNDDERDLLRILLNAGAKGGRYTEKELKRCLETGKWYKR